MSIQIEQYINHQMWPTICRMFGARAEPEECAWIVRNWVNGLGGKGRDVYINEGNQIYFCRLA